jgi:predicted Zn-dependent protease
LAERSLKDEPKSTRLWVTLGVARYQQGKWQAAISALDTGLRQNAPDTGRGTFYLAMTYARQGDGDRARRFYEEAVKWMNNHQPRNPDLIRLRVEAEAALKMSNQPRQNQG